MLKYNCEQYTAYLPRYSGKHYRAYAGLEHFKAQLPAGANKRDVFRAVVFQKQFRGFQKYAFANRA